jgi:hypothetical protein
MTPWERLLGRVGAAASREIQHFITEEAIEEKGFGEIAQHVEI